MAGSFATRGKYEIYTNSRVHRVSMKRPKLSPVFHPDSQINVILRRKRERFNETPFVPRKRIAFSYVTKAPLAE